MENKPSLYQIYEHAVDSASWQYFPFLIYCKYIAFREVISKDIPTENLSMEQLGLQNEFIDWLLERYWPDWRDSENG